MKNFKRISCVVIAIVMVFAMMVPAMASDYKITVTNAKEGETYTAYKLFDAAYDTGTNISYTYEVTDGDDAGKLLLEAFTVEDGGIQKQAFIFEAAAGKPNTYVVTTVRELRADDAAALAVYLQNAQDAATVENPFPFTAAGSATTAENAETVIDVGAPGYYFVDTTTGSLCAINTAKPTVEIRDKNEEPKIEKTVEENSEYGDTSYAEVGETVNFKIVVTAQKGAENYVVHDELSAGLTLDDSSIAIADLIKDEDYTLVAHPDDDCTFEILFDETYLGGITDETEITITYSAKLNKLAINTDDNSNAAVLTYGENSTTAEAKTTTDSFELDLRKYAQGIDVLDGAEFKLFDALTDGNQIGLVEIDQAAVEAAGDTYDANTKYYRVADATETPDLDLTIKAGKAKIYGLDGNKAYYLEEIVAPEGYNILTERKALEKNATATDKTVAVENNSGTELPSTGGIGTTIFYLVGGLMVTGAFILLITKKRMGNRA